MINKYFLAKMNIPAYLKKFLYNRYSYRYTEIEGIPPIIFKGNGKNLLDYRIYGASGGVGDRTSNLCESFTSTMSTVQYANALLIKANFQESTTYVISFKLTEGCVVYANETIFTQSVRTVGQGQNSTINVTLTTLSDLSNAQMLNNFYRVFKNAITQENSPVFYDVQIIQGNNAPLNYEPYGYKVPVVVNGKNLLKPDGTPTTIRGVSWSYREDGAVVGERVSSNENISDFTLINSSTFKPGSYIFSRFDDESTPGSSTYQANISINGVSHWGTGNYSFVLNEASTIRVVLRVYPNFTGKAIFKPMIRLSSIQESNYEAYIEPTTTNIYLDEPIGENESISLSDTNVNISTIRGTNVLTVDTTVQPSNVYIKVGGG